MPQSFDSLDFDRVRTAFNRAASRYNAHALVQKTVQERLLERFDPLQIECHTLLDIGSGTGGALKGLRRHFKRAHIVQTDFAEQMLRQQQDRRLFSREKSRICADSHALPIKAGVVDVVFSNLMLQWCSDPLRVFEEVKQALRPGGLFLFSTFGRETLKELKQSWQAVDGTNHVNHFYDMHEVGETLSSIGFSDMVLDMEKLTVYYSDVTRLMHDLRAIGATNKARSRRKSLAGKKRMERMIAAYETLRVAEGLPTTYEVVYGNAWNLQPEGVIESSTGEVRIPLHKISRAGREGADK